MPDDSVVILEHVTKQYGKGAHTIGTRGGTRKRCVLPWPNAMYW